MSWSFFSRSIAFGCPPLKNPATVSTTVETTPLPFARLLSARFFGADLAFTTAEVLEFADGLALALIGFLDDAGLLELLEVVVFFFAAGLLELFPLDAALPVLFAVGDLFDVVLELEPLPAVEAFDLVDDDFDFELVDFFTVAMFLLRLCRGCTAMTE